MIQLDKRSWERNKKHYVQLSENCFVRHLENGTSLFRDKNGIRHREDGPARDAPSGEYTTSQWYVNDIFCENAFDYQKLTGRTDDEMIMLMLKYGDLF